MTEQVWFHFCKCCIGLMVMLFIISLVGAVGTNGDVFGLFLLFGGIFVMILIILGAAGVD